MVTQHQDLSIPACKHAAGVTPVCKQGPGGKVVIDIATRRRRGERRHQLPAEELFARVSIVCRQGPDGKKVIDIALDGAEASDYINFVLKDAATNTWYDSNGSNFQMALTSALRSFASLDDAEMVRAASLVANCVCGDACMRKSALRSVTSLNILTRCCAPAPCVLHVLLAMRRSQARCGP
jgi:hypothetical protein